MGQGYYQCSKLRLWIAATFFGVLLGLVAPLMAIDSLPGPRFVPEERWLPDDSVKNDPPLYEVSSVPEGTAVVFPAGDSEVTAVITSTRWKVSDPVAVAPVHLALVVSTTSTDLKVSPVLVDAEGADFTLTALPATAGTLQWDLPADCKKTGNQPGAKITGDGKSPVGPVYLKEIRISKMAGPAASITFSRCDVAESPKPPTAMMLASDLLWNFDQNEGWVDVHNNDEGRAQYNLTYGPDGTTITVKPLKRGMTLKLATLTQLHDGQFGHARRIITHIDYDGPPGVVSVGLGMKDAEREVLGIAPPATQPAVPNTLLNVGNTDIIWDAANVSSSRRGAHNGYPDFPIGLDDYTITVRNSDQPVKIVFGSATIESWQPVVRAMGMDAGRPRFLWTPGEKATLGLKLKNIGPHPFDEDIQFVLKDDMARELWNRSVHVVVAPASTGLATIEIETKDLAQGIYLLDWASADGSNAIKGRTLLTVADDKPLPKGSDGEFVFGMDPGARWNQTPILDWADWCGVDTIRNAGRDPYFLGAYLPEYLNAVGECTKHGMRSNIMLFANTPWDPNPTKFAQKIAESAHFAGTAAAALKDTNVHWYEIGNEPSLTAFFHGPPADYDKFFLSVADAIRAADPQAIVTVGGLAFAGMAGAEPRAKQIIQLMPLDKIDGFGYHGHGEGSKSERWALETEMRRFAKDAGKDTKPYYETESGTTSTEPLSWREQARTVVQKFAYAQSTHVVPVFMWFGFHPNWEWGILQNLQEAKPAALAYRVYVQHVRHLVGQDRLNLPGAQGEAYWFKSKDPSDNRFVMVLWSDFGEFTREINLGKQLTNVQQMDLFGNAKPLSIEPSGLVRVDVSEDPTYVLANRPADSAVPIILSPAIDVAKEIRVVPGSIEHLKLTVSNSSGQPLAGTIVIKANGAAPIEKSETPISIAAAGKSSLAITMKIGDQPVEWWPRSWTVFAPVKGDIDLSKFSEIPAVMGDENVMPQVGIVDEGGLLNIEPLGHGRSERKQAICFSKLTLDQETDAEIGVAADYWMQFYVNGDKVLDTMVTGNGGGYDLLAHVIKIHLKKGENILAAKVLSGSGGWKLVSGGPLAVASARRARAGIIDAAVFELRDGENVIDRESARITMLPYLQVRAAETDWDSNAPDAVTGHVDNFFMKQPDSSKWYHGPADLSGKVWFSATPQGELLVTVAVRDDIDMPKDSAVIELASGEGWTKRLELRSGRDAVIKRKRDDATTTTWYEATIPASQFALQPREKIAINVTVDDADWGEVKQRTSITTGDDPSNWYQTWQR